MAPISSKILFMFLLSIVIFHLFSTDVQAHGYHRPHKNYCNINAIYQLGDSISDTGNLVREPFGGYSPFARLPYGETFFNRSTGRCSNGLLMVDFLANALDLPLLNPYMDKEAIFDHGVNFAVAGSTALDFSFLASNNIINPVTNSSLLVQVEWLKSHLNSTCKSKTECATKLENSLFMVGEIGGNDYNYAFLQNKTIEETEKLVPHVVQNIISAAKEVIALGALRVVIPGNFPIGCLPIYLTQFRSNESTSYDGNKCLIDLNNFARYHNLYLQGAIKQLRKEYPNVAIMYADYYNAYLWVLRNAGYLGFQKESVQKACCGTGGDYNFNLTNMCGLEGTTVCPDPERHMSWDGIHSTQKAYQHMAEWLMLKLWPQSRCI